MIYVYDNVEDDGKKRKDKHINMHTAKAGNS
jgi:hypothetical protein